MESKPQQDNPQTKKYETGTPIIIGTGNNLFYDKEIFPREKSNLYHDLSEDMEKIRNKIGIAVDNLTKQKFIDFYDNGIESEFKGARLTPLLDPDNKTEIGFLFSIFYIREEKDENGNAKSVFIGKAFPGIRVEDRIGVNNNKKWDRNWLYDSFLDFYFAEIVEIIKKNQATAPSINLQKLSEEGIQEIMKYLLNPTHTLPEMRLEVFIENPLTYNDLCKYGFIYNIKKPTQEFIRESARWDTAELLKQSYINTLGPGPEYLKKNIAFSVNITLLEWRKAFEPMTKKKNGKIVKDAEGNTVYEYNNNIRYYVWQNYYFPNNAFKAVIPLDAHNVWKVILGSRENSIHNSQILTENLIEEMEKKVKPKNTQN